MWSTWELFVDSIKFSLDAVPEGIDPEEVRSYLKDLPGVSEVHDLHIWPMSTTETALTAHLVVPGAQMGNNALIQKASEGLHEKFEIVHTTLQLESGEPENPSGLASPEVV